MSQLVSAVDINHIKQLFENLALEESKNFEQQVSGLTELYLKRIRDSLAEKLSSYFTGYAETNVTDLITEFNLNLTKIIDNYKNQLLTGAEQITNEAIKSNGENAKDSALDKINHFFQNDFKSTVERDIKEFSDFGETVVADSIKKISELAV